MAFCQFSISLKFCRNAVRHLFTATDLHNLEIDLKNLKTKITNNNSAANTVFYRFVGFVSLGSISI